MTCADFSPRTTWILAAAAVVAGRSPLTAQAQPPAAVAPDVYSHLHWRYIGPEGNRISAVAGVPGDPLVYYAGAPRAASTRPPTAA